MTEIAERALSDHEAATYRAEFPIFEHTTYLNSCSLGPPSRRVIAALEQYTADWSRYGAPAWWKVWLPKLDMARQRFARLIGAADHEVTISHSVSSALASIGSALDYRTRTAVVCADLDFPTIPYQWLSKQSDGVEVRFARSHDKIRVPLETYRTAIDERVAAVATSHVFYTTGAIQPIRELSDLAHAAGATMIVDGYHAVGAIPVDVKALDVDFYVGGTLKWLLGGPGLTFIYVREELIPQLHPTITGWFSSSDQFAFDSLHLEWPQSADRLQLGTPSVPTAYAGVAGMDMVLEADPQRIWSRIGYLSQRVVDRAKREGFEVVSPMRADERGGIVMLNVKQPQETVEKLAQCGFTVDYRPGLVRVSPHFYNTTEDVDRFMDALTGIQSDL